MKESIYTIPISHAFEAAQGCPFCSIRRTLEQKWVEYITGPAMMEPDVREITNKLGFCRKHYESMLAQKNRLSVALMLETRLAEISTGLSGKSRLNIENCFICEKIDAEFERIIENTAIFWAREEDFHKMYMQQKYVCVPDCAAVLRAARKKLHGRRYNEFAKITSELTLTRLLSLKSDIDAFCKLYDYRSANEKSPGKEIAEAIERSIPFLVGE